MSILFHFHKEMEYEKRNGYLHFRFFSVIIYLTVLVNMLAEFVVNYRHKNM